MGPFINTPLKIWIFRDIYIYFYFFRLWRFQLLKWLSLLSPGHPFGLSFGSRLETFFEDFTKTTTTTSFLNRCHIPSSLPLLLDRSFVLATFVKRSALCTSYKTTQLISSDLFKKLFVAYLASWVLSSLTNRRKSSKKSNKNCSFSLNEGATTLLLPQLQSQNCLFIILLTWLKIIVRMFVDALTVMISSELYNFILLRDLKKAFCKIQIVI